MSARRLSARVLSSWGFLLAFSLCCPPAQGRTLEPADQPDGSAVGVIRHVENGTFDTDLRAWRVRLSQLNVGTAYWADSDSGGSSSSGSVGLFNSYVGPAWGYTRLAQCLTHAVPGSVYEARTAFRAGAEGLSPHHPDAELIQGYRDLIRLVLLKTGKARYVSKNNNTVLRLGALAAAMPEATFLVPLRRPLDHAASLLGQHQRFLAADAFTRDYMTWLGHHEFGATHRPFLFGGRPAGDPMTLAYWLRLWLAVYGALDQVEAAHPNVTFVPYEALSADPAVWEAVARRIGVIPAAAEELRPTTDKAPGPHDAGLAADAGALHARLAARGFAALGLPAG